MKEFLKIYTTDYQQLNAIDFVNIVEMDKFLKNQRKKKWMS